MITIRVNVCGDHWINPEEVQAQLDTADALEPVVFNFGAEGPSLAAIGLMDMINAHCNTTGRSLTSLHVVAWPNTAEKLQVGSVELCKISHFFSKSDVYRRDQFLPSTHEHLFGCFIGRRTIARGVILYDLWKHHKQHTLLSCMYNRNINVWEKSKGKNLESLDQWVPTDQQADFVDWWKSCPVSSIDQHSVADQYRDGQNTNLDLLAHYHKFDIEIVCETYTLGETFFPTEKTIRPIMGKKPWLIYGPENYLRRLQELGFQTFDTLWSEEYDQFSGPVRWQYIQQVIQNLTNLSTADRCALLDKASLITEHNWKVLEDLARKHSTK